MLLNALKYDLIYLHETATLRVHKKCGDCLLMLWSHSKLVAKDFEKATNV